MTELKEKITNFAKRAWNGFLGLFHGTSKNLSFFEKLITYVLLVLLGFVYIYPILYMLAYSFMSLDDVINPLVKYYPAHFNLQNFSQASVVLDFWKSLLRTLYISILPSLLQIASTSLLAYALARFRFLGRKIIFCLVFLTFIIPPQITMMPQIIFFNKLKILESILSYLIPASLGQGIKSAVFVLVFFQFFDSIPKSLEESAMIDGAKTFKIFLKIGIPTAMPAYLLGFLLSFVWYYNETNLFIMYFGSASATLPVQLESFKSSYETIYGTAVSTGKSINEAIYMAGTMLCIAPLLIIYFITQKFFVEGIDRAGITGE